MAVVEISLAQVAGRNARRLRLDAGVTLEQVAAATRPYGLRWSSGRVGDFEGGRVAPSLSTLYAVALTLRDVTGQPVALRDLFDGDDDATLTDSLAVPLESLRSSLSGLPVGYEIDPAKFRLMVRPPEETGAALVRAGVSLQLRESDYRLIKNLEVSPDIAVAAMAELWRRPFSVERDARAGADANAQGKGQISRQLKTELREALAVKGKRKTSNTRGAKRGNS